MPHVWSRDQSIAVFVFSVPSANGEGPPRVGDRHLRISDNPAIFPPRSHYNACSRYRPPYAIFHSARAFLPPSFDSNEWTLCVTLYNPDRKIFLKSRISRIKNNVVFLSWKKERIHFQSLGRISAPRFRVNGRTSCSFYWWWIATISARSSVYG